LTNTARKFEFGVEFSEDGEVLRDTNVQRIWNELELELERARAREAGAGDASAQAAREQAQALKAMASQLSLVLAHLTRLTEELRADAAALALATARKIAGAAIDQYPQAELEALVQACAAELRAAPRLRVTLPAAHAETLQLKLEEMLDMIGFAGALRVAVSDRIAPGGCALDWDQGAVDADPARTLARIEALVEQRLKEAPPPQVDLFAARARGRPEDEA
jgi:flagellar assembly protein FliH